MKSWLCILALTFMFRDFSLMGYGFVKTKVTKRGMLHGPNAFCHFAILMEKRFNLQKNGFFVPGACLLRKQ